MGRVIIKILASGLGLGFLPKAPGTWGTLLALPIWYAIKNLTPLSYMMFTFVSCIFAVIIAHFALEIFKTDDAPQIVVDEIAGFLVAMTWLPSTWQTVAAAFILFRILDALKPGPIGYVDKKIKGGIGIVADDILAGIVTNIILQMIYTNTSWLGAHI